MTKIKILITSIISMTLLIGLTANFAFAGGDDVDEGSLVADAINALTAVMQNTATQGPEGEQGPEGPEGPAGPPGPPVGSTTIIVTSAGFTLGSGSPQGTVAACPANAPFVLGGGYDIVPFLPLGFDASLTSTRPLLAGDGWEVGVDTGSSPPPPGVHTIHAWAICAP